MPAAPAALAFACHSGDLPRRTISLTRSGECPWTATFTVSFLRTPTLTRVFARTGSPNRLSIAIEEPRQLLQAKAMPVRRNCFITFFQSPSVPVVVRWRLSNTSW